MSELFQAKIRRIGNSFGVIIPREITTQVGVEGGDIVHVSIWTSPLKERNDLLQDIMGSYEGKDGFEREREDRY